MGYDESRAGNQLEPTIIAYDTVVDLSQHACYF